MKQLPTKWSEVIVSDFMKIIPVIQSEEHESNIEKLIDIAITLTGTDLGTIPLQEVAKLEFLCSPDQISKKIPKYFLFHRKVYKPIINFKTITGGQYIDLTTYSKVNIYENLHILSAIVCDECTWYGERKKYDGVNMLKRAELFKELPITTIYPITLFFCQNLENLMAAIPTYLEAQIQKQLKEVSQMFGDGILT